MQSSTFTFPEVLNGKIHYGEFLEKKLINPRWRLELLFALNELCLNMHACVKKYQQLDLLEMKVIQQFRSYSPRNRRISLHKSEVNNPQENWKVHPQLVLNLTSSKSCVLWRIRIRFCTTSSSFRKQHAVGNRVLERA